MSLLIVCLILQVLLSLVVPLTWWLPDLAIAALMIAVIRRPQHWLSFGLVCAIGLVPSVQRHAAVALLSPCFLAGFTAWLSRRWQLNSAGAAAMACGLGSFAVTLVCLLGDHLLGPSTQGLLLIRVLMTAFVGWLLPHHAQSAASP